MAWHQLVPSHCLNPVPTLTYMPCDMCHDIPLWLCWTLIYLLHAYTDLLPVCCCNTLAVHYLFYIFSHMVACLLSALQSMSTAQLLLLLGFRYICQVVAKLILYKLNPQWVDCVYWFFLQLEMLPGKIQHRTCALTYEIFAWHFVCLR